MQLLTLAGADFQTRERASERRGRKPSEPRDGCGRKAEGIHSLIHSSYKENCVQETVHYKTLECIDYVLFKSFFTMGNFKHTQMEQKEPSVPRAFQP